jgi:hypothetical protein
VVPLSGAPQLIERLLETPDDPRANESLFTFLNRRVPKAVLKSVLERTPELAGRKGEPPSWYRLARSEEVLLRAAAHKLGLLSGNVRSETVGGLTDGAAYSLDTSFIRNDEILAMFKPRELIDLTGRILAMLHTEISEKIAEQVNDADPDSDIDDQFETLREFLYDTSSLTDADNFFSDKHSELMDELEQAKKDVLARKSDDDDDDDDSFFSSVPRAAKVERREGRSVFSDVDE